MVLILVFIIVGAKLTLRGSSEGVNSFILFVFSSHFGYICLEPGW